MDIPKKLVRGSLWSFLHSLINSIFAFILAIYLARRLGAEAYGIVVFVVGIATTFHILSQFGVANSTSKFISQYLVKDKSLVRSIIRDGFSINLIIAFFIALICFLLAGLISSLAKLPQIVLPVKLISGYIFFSSLLTFFEGVFQGLNIFGYRFLVRIVRELARIFWTVAMVEYGLGVAGVTGGYSLGSATSTIIITVWFYFKFFKNQPKSDIKMYKEIFKYSIPLAIISANVFIYTRIDILMLGFLSTPEQTGFYGLTVKIGDLVRMPLSVLSVVLLPNVTYLLNKKDLKQAIVKIEEIYNRLLKYGFMYMIPSVIGLYILSPYIFKNIFGIEYLGSSSLLKVFCIYLLLSTLVGAHTLYVASGHASIVAKFTGGTAAINFLLNLLLIPKYHGMGAVIATIISRGSALLIITFMAWKMINIKVKKEFIVSIPKIFVASFFMSILVGFLKNLITDVMSLIMVIFAGAFTFLFFILIIGGIKIKEFLTVVGYLSNKVDK
ncbi:MAG: flippase [Candidatus Helarchaeota archaeon]